jgi:tetratricopeptide (TPR) repeat protein
MDLYSIKNKSFEYLNSNRTFLKYGIDGVLYNELEDYYKVSRMCVAAGRLDISIFWIQNMLPLLRNDPGTNDKELGTFLSVLGSRLTQNNEPEEAIKVLGEAMLKIKNIPDSEEKDMLVRENYRAMGTSFYDMDKSILAIYYFTMFLSFDHLIEERHPVTLVNHYLSSSYYCIGQLEESIKYAHYDMNMHKDGKEFCLFRIGNAFKDLGDFPKAYKYHADGFKIRKSHPDPVHRQKYLYRSYRCVASCQMNMKYYSLAIKNYTKAINLIETNVSDKSYLRECLVEFSHCYAMLGQFQEAYDATRKAADIMVNVCITNTINLGLLQYKMNKQKEPFLSDFFKLWMSKLSTIRFVAMCLRKLFPEDLSLFKKLLTQHLDKKRQHPKVVAEEIRSHFRQVFNSVMMSKHINTSVLSLRRSLINQ